MSKKYKDIESDPIMASEPVASYGVSDTCTPTSTPDNSETARENMRRSLKRQYALQHDMTPEELYSIIAEEIEEIYANG